jgi:hypothetical protein
MPSIAFGSGSVDVRYSDPVAVAVGPIDFIHVVIKALLAWHQESSRYFSLGIDGSKSEKNLWRQTRLSEGREAYWKENGRDVSKTIQRERVRINHVLTRVIRDPHTGSLKRGYLDRSLAGWLEKEALSPGDRQCTEGSEPVKFSEEGA